jgi:addiction module RelE/StbE family toxin
MKNYNTRNMEEWWLSPIPKKTQEQFKARLRVFVNDIFDPILENHALHGKYLGLRSINVTGDYRALYSVLSETSIEFVLIDTHSGLYE